IGKGVTALVGGRRVAIGTEAFLRELGVDPSALATKAAALREAGETVTFVAEERQLRGALGVVDPIKKTTKEAIAALDAEGIRVVMLTGDHRASAEAVGKELGIDEIVADSKPQDKAAAVARMQSSGRTVAVAGDGINDAPALALADVGIAMGTGADVA